MLNWDIIPFKGVGKFKLYSSVEDVKKILDDEKFSYSEEIQRHETWTIPEPWILISIKDTINFWFAKNKLFEIWVEKKFNGKLRDGRHVGMSMKEACKIDSELKFDDWEENWESSDGYWIEDEMDTKQVIKIAVFIKEVLDYDLFEKYEWC